MKYYFTAQTSMSSDEDKRRYKGIIALLGEHGHENVNYVHMDEGSSDREQTTKEIEAKNITPFDYQLSMLARADALVCDATEPSSTVGFQIMYAISNKIPCLVLSFQKLHDGHETRPAVIFTNSHNGLLKFIPLDSLSELPKAVDEFQSECINKPFKFNFYIPLGLYNRLSRVAGTKDVTRSDVMRDALEKYLTAQEAGA